MGKISVAKGCQPAMRGGDPQCSGAVLDEVRYPAVVEVGRVGAIKGGEASAIKSTDPILGCHPEITIACLQNLHDRGLRQPIFRPPDGMYVLRQRLVWIERAYRSWRGDAAQKKDRRQQAPDQSRSAQYWAITKHRIPL
jgi:hypothetical protein